MFPKTIQQFLKSFHKNEIQLISSVGGGSINEAFRYSANNQQYFVKFNNQIEGIIESEVDGLNAIIKASCIATPEVIAFKKVDDYEILVLPFINTGLKSDAAWEKFGQQLAEMHRQPAPYFGWHKANFIGSLFQSNEKASSFIEFFIHQRLKPQIDLAVERHYFSAFEMAQFEKLFKKLNEIIPDTMPSLVHGDLWSGNFMIGEDSKPYLIDPSIHYSFRETDLAFTHLFGGFDSRFYEAYNNHFPLDSGFFDRVALYNLYPLLVHLNLFGRGYYNSVLSNLSQYVR